MELLSPLYGMAEAHQYYDKWLTNVLLKMGFKQAADPKYYIKWKGKEFSKLPLYVDDMSVQWRGRTEKLGIENPRIIWHNN